MATIPMEYFQAGATAIPTILIALAVGARQGTTWAKDMQKETRLGRILAICIVSFCVLVIVGGETSALVALFTGHRTIMEADMVWAGVMIGLLLLIVELIKPVMEVLKKREKYVLQAMIVFIWLLINYAYITARWIFFLV